ncbi:MAG: hypothetical protein IKF36_04905 [Bacilli bacterium]|nr:hypothetical protein [Bacilli bacterium]
MEYLKDILPIIIYILLIILITLLIVLCIKALKTLKKVDGIVDNVDKKVRALDGLFSIVEVTIDKITAATETIIGGFVGFFESLFKKKKIKKEEDE